MEEEKYNQNPFYDSFSDLSVLNCDEDGYFYEWYLLCGSGRIKELSRQLRTFFNYKEHIIRIRFSKDSQKQHIHPKESIESLKDSFYSYSSSIVELLKKLEYDGESISEKLSILLEKVRNSKNKYEIKIFKEIKELSSKSWRIIHVFSEKEIYHQIDLIRMVIKVAQILSSIEIVFSSELSKFFIELKKIYDDLGEEFSKINKKDKRICYKKLDEKEQERIYNEKIV